jgi:hypothetical protein
MLKFSFLQDLLSDQEFKIRLGDFMHINAGDDREISLTVDEVLPIIQDDIIVDSLRWEPTVGPVGPTMYQDDRKPSLSVERAEKLMKKLSRVTNSPSQETGKPKTDRVPKTSLRPCRFCDGSHWDNDCPDKSKK